MMFVQRLSAWTLALLFLSGASPTRAQQIWFAPPDDLPRGVKIMNDDFSRFWSAPKDWSLAASHISVFILNPYYASVGSEDDLRRISNSLRQKGIALGVGLQALPVEGCGKGIEGMTKEGAPGTIARRLKKFGLDVKYFALDEPLFFGAFYRGANACKYTLEEVAQRLASTIKDVRSVYPDVKIIEYETSTDLPPAEWISVLERWLNSYRAETGIPLDYMALDTNWRKPWKGVNRSSSELLHRYGVKVGQFLDATGGPAVTDESWMAEAKKNISDVWDADLNLDFVIIASWMLHPQRNLPEGDPLTLTALVNWYVSHKGARTNH